MAKKINQSVLTQADKIINERSEEKERMYGPFSEGMRRAAMIATGMTGKEFTGSDIYACMVALKLSRHSYAYKRDNILDACAYLGVLENYVDEYGYKDTEEPVELGEKSNEGK